MSTAETTNQAVREDEYMPESFHSKGIRTSALDAIRKYIRSFPYPTVSMYTCALNGLSAPFTPGPIFPNPLLDLLPVHLILQMYFEIVDARLRPRRI